MPHRFTVKHEMRLERDRSDHEHSYKYLQQNERAASDRVFNISKESWKQRSEETSVNWTIYKGKGSLLWWLRKFSLWSLLFAPFLKFDEFPLASFRDLLGSKHTRVVNYTSTLHLIAWIHPIIPSSRANKTRISSGPISYLKSFQSSLVCERTDKISINNNR